MSKACSCTPPVVCIAVSAISILLDKADAFAKLLPNEFSRAAHEEPAGVLSTRSPDDNAALGGQV
jgi:hypothetical protein